MNPDLIFPPNFGGPVSTGSAAVLDPIHKLLRDTNMIGSGYKNFSGALNEHTLKNKMQESKTPEEWLGWARYLDYFLENDKWRDKFEDAVLEKRIQAIRNVRESGDIAEISLGLRTLITRELASIADIHVYERALVDSPFVIKRYLEEARLLIYALASADVDSRDSQGAKYTLINLLSGMLSARQCFGRSGLFLSGGATLGMAHIGVIKTLFRENVLPEVISGASAGSIIAAILCTHTDAELPNLFETVHTGDLAVFGEEGTETEVIWQLIRLINDGTWSDIRYLQRVLDKWLGNTTFEEAFKKTNRICNITVSAPDQKDHRRILNYMVAPDVTIASAVEASCAVPYIFNPAKLYAKNRNTGEITLWSRSEGEAWIDGSVECDVPTQTVAEMFNVNSFIVCQVNPHVIPFATEDKDRHDDSTLRKMMSAGASDLAHRVGLKGDNNILSTMGEAPVLDQLESITSQYYTGHVTILPKFPPSMFLKLMHNPTPTFMQKACLIGEQATWPKLQRIRDLLAIEKALEEGTRKIRARLSFHSEAADKRRRILFSSKVQVPALMRRQSGGDLPPAVGMRYVVSETFKKPPYVVSPIRSPIASQIWLLGPLPTPSSVRSAMPSPVLSETQSPVQSPTRSLIQSAAPSSVRSPIQSSIRGSTRQLSSSQSGSESWVRTRLGSDRGSTWGIGSNAVSHRDESLEERGPRTIRSAQVVSGSGTRPPLMHPDEIIRADRYGLDFSRPMSPEDTGSDMMATPSTESGSSGIGSGVSDPNDVLWLRRRDRIGEGRWANEGMGRGGRRRREGASDD